METGLATFTYHGLERVLETFPLLGVPHSSFSMGEGGCKDPVSYYIDMEEGRDLPCAEKQTIISASTLYCTSSLNCAHSNRVKLGEVSTEKQGCFHE